jgi:hypothetical protein
MDQRRGLVGNGLHQLGMRMAKAIHRNPGDSVEVTLAGFIPQVRALPAHESDRLAGIGIHQVFRTWLSGLLALRHHQVIKAIRRPKPP